MHETIFTKIINREIPADIIFENDSLIAIRDINPQAPVHILIIPKKHIPTINDLQNEDANIMGEIFMAAKNIAQKEGLSERGYRLVINCNEEAGQSVFHSHCHLLGGRAFNWPPG